MNITGQTDFQAPRIAGIRIRSGMLLLSLILAIAAAPAALAADDEAITIKAKTELARNDITDNAAIEVTTRDGIVRLSGETNSAHQKRMASEIASRIPSVKSVENRLVVRAE